MILFSIKISNQISKNLKYKIFVVIHFFRTFVGQYHLKNKKMKKSTFIFSLVIALATTLYSCGQKAKETTKTAEKSDTTSIKAAYFGEKITENDAIAAAELPKMLEKMDSTNTKIKAKIVQTCKKKGCWMDVEFADGKTMKITFKDYGFFVPKEGMEGKEVIMQGTAKKTVTDVATLKHYAEDAKKSKAEIDAITKPSEAITFEATGVIIKG